MKVFLWVMGFLAADFLFACLIGKMLKCGNPEDDVETQSKVSQPKNEEVCV